MPKAKKGLLGIAVILLSMMASTNGAASKSDIRVESKPLTSFRSPPPIPKHVLSSTYKVRTVTKVGPYTTRGNGSAFGVDLSSLGIEGKGYLLTAAHVVLDNGKISGKIEVEIRYAEYNGRAWVRARVVKYDKRVDIAIIKVDQDLPSLATVPKKDEIKVGDPILAVGCPDGYGVTPSWGYLTSKVRETKHQHKGWWQGSAPVHFGNSGGPVWNPKNNSVIGIVTAIVGTRGYAPNVVLFVSHDSMVKFLSARKVRKAIEKLDKKKRDKEKKEREKRDKEKKKKKDKEKRDKEKRDKEKKDKEKRDKEKKDKEKRDKEKKDKEKRDKEKRESSKKDPKKYNPPREKKDKMEEHDESEPETCPSIP